MDEALFAFAKEQLRPSDPWTQAIVQLGENLFPSEKELSFLKEALLKGNICSQNDYTSFLKRFFLYTSLIKKSSLPTESFNDLKEKFSSHSFFYQSTFSQLVFLYAFYDEAALSSIDLFNPDKDFYCERLPDLEMWIYSAALLFLIAQQYKNPDLLKQSFQITNLIHQFFDKKGDPFLGLWIKERAFCEKDRLLVFNLFKQLHEKLFLPINMEESNGKSSLKNSSTLQCFEDNFICFLMKMIDLEDKPALVALDNNSSFHKKLATITYQGDNLSGALTLCGKNSSLGTLHVEDVHIITLGFQYFPLSSSEHFGQFRPYHNQDTFQGSEIHQEKKSSVLEGWTRLTKNQTGSNLWTEMKSFFKQDKCHLNFYFHGQKFTEKLAFVFYIQAKSCQIEKKTLVSTSLDQYFGALTNKLSFRGKNGALTVQAKGPNLMHIIPLAGNNCFWQANFLLAFEIEPMKDYHFIVKKT